MAITFSEADMRKELNRIGISSDEKTAIVALMQAFLTKINTELASGALETEVDNLNAWATALATKLNADAGVTDADYDTDPQA